MSLATTMEALPEEVVGQFLDAFQFGRVVDALDVFALDGVIRDADGREHRGIREIAAFVSNARSPSPVHVEGIRRDGETVTAVVRSVAGGRESRLRHTYTLSGGRVRSLQIEKLHAGRRGSSALGRA
jgi:hypothetical protein